jgi:serine/threonine-protein kinase RsbW
MKRSDLTIDADIENLSKIAEFLEDVLGECEFSGEVLFNVQLAVDEACSNTILYGFPGGGGAIEIACEVDDAAISIVIADQGMPFDPLTAPEPDIEADIADRQIGGLGVYFIRTVMDEVAYEYTGEKNVLTLKKYARCSGAEMPGRTA